MKISSWTRYTLKHHRLAFLCPFYRVATSGGLFRILKTEQTLIWCIMLYLIFTHEMKRNSSKKKQKRKSLWTHKRNMAGRSDTRKNVEVKQMRNKRHWTDAKKTFLKLFKRKCISDHHHGEQKTQGRCIQKISFYSFWLKPTVINSGIYLTLRTRDSYEFWGQSWTRSDRVLSFVASSRWCRGENNLWLGNYFEEFELW